MIEIVRKYLVWTKLKPLLFESKMRFMRLLTKIGVFHAWSNDF